MGKNLKLQPNDPLVYAAFDAYGNKISKYKTFCPATVTNKLRKRRAASKSAKKSRRKAKRRGTAHKSKQRESAVRSVAHKFSIPVQKLVDSFTPGGLISPREREDGGEFIAPLSLLKKKFYPETSQNDTQS